MKDLPEPPKPWTPKPEHWFYRHEHTGDSRPEICKTLSAMWLTLHDRMRLPLPTAPREFGIVELAMFARLHRHFGEATMSVWRSACNHVKADENPEEAFKNLLAAKGLEDE